MSSAQIFGLIRQKITIAGIPLIKCNSLTPAERIWLQENTTTEEAKFNEGYLAFVSLVQKSFGLADDFAAYDLVKSYYRGTLEDTAQANKIELLAMKNPLPTRTNVRIEQMTYLMNSRIVKAEFPIAAFAEVFGLTYAGAWTIDFMKSIEEIQDKFEAFFDGEADKSNGESEPEKKEDPTVPQQFAALPTLQALPTLPQPTI